MAKKQDWPQIPDALRDFVLHSRLDALAVMWRDRVVLANPAFARLFGYAKPEEVRGLNTDAFVTIDYASLAKERVAKRMSGDAPPDAGVYDCVRADGTGFRGEAHSLAWTRDYDFALTMVRDVTEREDLISDLSRAQTYAETLADMIPVGVIVSDPAGNNVFANQHVCTLTGYSHEEIMGGLASLADPDDPTHRDGYFQALSEGRGFDVETRFRRKDGTQFWVLYSWRPAFGPDGQLQGECHSFVDITDHKRVQQALNEAYARYQAIVDSIHALIYICSQDYHIEFMNQRMIERTGYYPLGEKCYKALHGLDEPCEWCVNERVFAGERVEWEVQSPLDKRWYHAVDTPINHPDGTVSKIGVIQDITDRKAVEQGIQALNDELECRVVERTAALQAANRALVKSIREQERADKALRAAEERYRLMAENASDIIWQMTMDGIFTYVSPAVRRYGYDPEDWIGSDLLPFLAPEEVPLYEQRRSAGNRHLGPQRYEVQMLCKDGSRVWMEVSIDFAIEDGRPVRIQGISRDITERKEAEQQLHVAYSRLQALFDHRIGGIGVVVSDSSGAVFQANDYFLRIIGHTRDELVAGQIDWRAITPPEWGGAEERGLEQLRDHGCCDAFEKEYERPDGSRCPVLVSGVALPGGGDEILVFALDITERKRAETELRESEERYRSIVENTRDLIMLTTADQKNVYFSPRCREVLGWDPEDLKEVSWWLVHPDDLQHVRDRYVEAFPDLPGSDMEYRIITKDEQTKWVSQSWAPIVTADGERIVASVIRDITERKLAEEALLAAHAKLEKAYQLQTEFLNNVTHEVRTPLTAVQGYAQMLLEGSGGPVNDEQTAMLRKVVDSSRDLLGIVNAVLEITRVRGGRSLPRPIACHPCRLVERAVSSVREQAEGRGLKVVVDMPERCRLGLYDADKISVVSSNLLSNAVKFTESGQVSSSVRYTSGGVDVVIVDTGIGMDPDDLPTIFDEFTQLDYPGKFKASGFGLGLAIVAAMVESMSATLVVSSARGVGTAFTLFLPILTDPEC